MTTKNELEFANKIISVAACLGASAADLFEDWHPAAPPATILFAGKFRIPLFYKRQHRLASITR